MNKIKRIFIWAVISLVIQTGVLFYLDNLFEIDTSSAVVTFKPVNKIENKKEDIAIFVPDNAENVSVSYDGGYLAYYEDDILTVVDIYSGMEKTIEFDENIKVSYFKWLPDRDRVLIAAKKEYKNSAKLLFYDYNAERQEKRQVKHKDGTETCVWIEKKAKVEDLQISTLTNMIYVKTALKGDRCSIHKINIMNRINKVYTKAYFIGNIRIIPRDDRIAYESLTHNRVYITGKSSSVSIDNVDKTCLIAVDSEDTIYVGEVKEEKNGMYKIVNVYYGKLNQDEDEWKKVYLPEPVNKTDIYVSSDGEIYINDNLRGIVTEISSGKKTEYKGMFIQMYDKGIVTISKGKLLKTLLK